ncbi:MAG: SGNH/GDSL hydrolase family protein [Oscillospiraceae bacterium]
MTDALFIGDSRMVGLPMYARLGEADYFAGVGLSVFQLFSQTASDTYFGETDLESLLCSREYGKIYIMLGLNEAGYDLDSLKERYRQDVERIQELQPDAVIYLLSGLWRSPGEKRAKATDYLRAVSDWGKSMPIYSRAPCDGEQVPCCLDPRALYEDDEGVFAWGL